ncbi:alpha-amylase family glycosyl hydrolase [Enterovirga sp.]|jgi:alpha-glucosidase|uniref:alpha-amylase family glycosyl hydrolase n=1 Tax=Enterovirga sp. TaxID=2026350 RepID=UPI002631A0CF|nr:alpha-amylase family glycosyl hydrolase [Enterovirga sp.]MDB5592118.1 alpha-amylase [Enterovirga sp.]
MLENTWWKSGIVYQVYPRSFQDSNGDGVGDLPGITSRLDYVAGLGVNAVWISPIFPSPMADFGYDVADYCGVDPLFGSLADMDALVARAHELGLRVILDFVPNHSSDQHPWFAESRSSRHNPKRDWYIWRDAKPDGSPPNNWVSNFGGSAWQWDEATGQYYYHAFLREQPDLNWRNPDLREAMHDVLRFWMDRGIDGFRVDVIWHLIKDAEFRDNPPNPGYNEGRPEIDSLLQVHSTDQPEVHDVIAGMRRVVDDYPDRVLIGEIYLPVERLVTYYGKDLSGAHLPFNFQLIQTAWNAHAIAKLVNEYEDALPAGGWPNWVLGNHDQPRIAARIGAAQARVAAMLLLTLRGTPTMYYGDEIGLARVEVPPDRVQDPWEKNEPGLGFNRDPERTPMQWDDGAHAGFSSHDPWLPLAEDYRQCNVAALSREQGSILNLYRRLIALRGASHALSVGSYVPIPSAEPLLAFRRVHGEEDVMVFLNLDAEPHTAELRCRPAGGRILLSTYLDRAGEEVGVKVALRPNEGLIVSATRG